MSSSQNALAIRKNATIIEAYDPHRANEQNLTYRIRRPALIGLSLIAVFLVGFGVWAATVPLAGGAIASGVISPDGSKRTVQHLEGGIIRRLLVRDGDVVKKGAPIIELESVQARASHDLLRKQQQSLSITHVRLNAEFKNRDKLTFPANYSSDIPNVRILIEGQQQLFHARRALHLAQKSVLRQRIAQLEAQIKGMKAQVHSASRQIELIAEEVRGKRSLIKKGYVRKTELARVMRMEAELSGRLGQYQASIASARQQIGETKLQLIAADAERADRIAANLDKTQSQLIELEEKMMSSKDVLSRTVVTAPVAGTIVNMQFKTESGVIPPGKPILDIVPADEKLVIDAQVAPNDIDIVRKGLQAKVQLSAISSRSAPRIDGVVRSVSADRLTDDKSGNVYYLARVEVNHADLKRFGPDLELVAGMPADVLIVTGERTMLNYLFRPFMDAIWKTFREN